MTTVNVDPETGEIIDIDGDFPEERALVVRQPEAVGLARAAAPGDLIDLASRMATALRDIVERQHLYAVISGKKYPTVEAWATIARMDNVVARESERPERHDDGAYEAFVELIRLTDQAVIGRGSAVCGAPDDKPWNSRPEYARRSMAVTRATSRAFRQHYSWIMALAGYEPTPADEMPHHEPAPTPPPATPEAVTLRGVASRGLPPVDGELRLGPDDVAVFGFSLKEPNGKKAQVIVTGRMAEELAAAGGVFGEVEATGTVEYVGWEKDGKKMPPYRRLHLTGIVAEALEREELDDELAAIADALP